MPPLVVPVNINTTHLSIATTSMPKALKTVFVSTDLGKIYGIDALKLIVIGVLLIICVFCCILLLYARRRYKQNQNKSVSTQPSHHEIANGVSLHHTYNIKRQPFNSEQYQSASNVAKPKRNPKLDNAAFNRIVNDRKTTVSHNPLHSPRSMHRIIINQSPSTMNQYNQYHPSVITKHPQSYPFSVSAQEINESFPETDLSEHKCNVHISKDDKDNSNSNSSNSSSSSSNFSSSSSNTMYKTEYTEDTKIVTTTQPNYEVVDTITNIVNKTKRKNPTTHVLSLNKMHIDRDYSIGVSSVGFNLEPSIQTSIPTSRQASELTAVFGFTMDPSQDSDSFIE